MYYEKLEQLYNESDLSRDFHIKILDYFDDFVRDELHHGYRYLNPYKFSLEYHLSMNDSIKIFLTFTDDDKLLKAEPFIDCINCSGKKLPFNSTALEENDGYIFCEDCGHEFEKGEIEKHFYIYFKLNDDIKIPDNKKNFNKIDYNSTYDLIQGMNGNLKEDSPSSSINILYGAVEGEFPEAFSLDELGLYNQDSEGNTLSNSISKLEEDLMNSLFDSVDYKNA